jgi:hypothetical protein
VALKQEEWVTTTPDENATALLLANRVRQKVPTGHFRFGDGQIQAIVHAGSKMCTSAGEVYSKELGPELERVMAGVFSSPEALIGDSSWHATIWDQYPRVPGQDTGIYLRTWLKYADALKGTFVHYEVPSLLETNSMPWPSRKDALQDFFRAVRHDDRRKAFMGPQVISGTAAILKAEYIEYPRHYTDISEIKGRLDGKTFDVLIYAAGIGGAIPVFDCWRQHPERSFINIGSAMDPLFMGRTRSQHVSVDEARAFFARVQA